MFANPFQALNSFFDNNNATRASAESYLKELALSNPNDSLDFYISILDIDNLKVIIVIWQIFTNSFCLVVG